MRRLFVLAAVLALVLVGCGGGGGDTSDPLAGGNSTGADAHMHSDDAPGAAAAGSCAPAGAALTITAKDIAFDKSCLAAPAGKAFTIKFDNVDAIPHNVTIQTSHTATDSFFSGELLTGPNKSTTYNVNAIPAGTYHFHCTVHPDQMNGTFVVK